MFRVDCIFCGKRSGNSYPLCNSCAPKPISQRFSCRVCGIETSLFVDICPNCNNSESSCIKNYSIFSYQGVSKEILKQYKFKKDYRFAQFYGEIIIDYINTNFNNPILVPIPTSYIKKVVKNGYQLDPIVSYIKKNSSIRIYNLLGKHLSKTQKTLSKKDRLKNLQSKFYLRRKVLEGVSIILFDDVYTTGSTIESAAKIIKKYNKTIYSITLARD